MKISILCSDPRHPVVKHLRAWADEMFSMGHLVAICHDRETLPGGDILFLVSCGQIIRDAERSKYRVSLVLHASDLPQGRGWSPYVWAILDGAHTIVVSLLEARDPVDSGDIWLKTSFNLEGHELLPEINELLFRAELSLMSQAVENLGQIKPVQQHGDPGPYLPRRTPSDSRVDPEENLVSQFNLLRVCDPERYPAYFDLHGHRYKLILEKIHEQTDD